MSSVWEHFFAATAILASAGPIKQRLAEAYNSHLADLDADDVPKEIREEFSALSISMCTMKPIFRGDTAVHATVRKMSDAEAGGIAMRIVDMLAAVARQPAQRPKLRAVGED